MAYKLLQNDVLLAQYLVSTVSLPLRRLKLQGNLGSTARPPEREGSGSDVQARGQTHTAGSTDSNDDILLHFYSFLEN